MIFILTFFEMIMQIFASVKAYHYFWPITYSAVSELYLYYFLWIVNCDYSYDHWHNISQFINIIFAVFNNFIQTFQVLKSITDHNRCIPKKSVQLSKTETELEEQVHLNIRDFKLKQYYLIESIRCWILACVPESMNLSLTKYNVLLHTFHIKLFQALVYLLKTYLHKEFCK